MSVTKEFLSGGFSGKPSWIERFEAESLGALNGKMEHLIAQHPAWGYAELVSRLPQPRSLADLRDFRQQAESELRRISTWSPWRDETPATAAEIHNYLDLEAEAETARAQKVLAYKRMYPSNAFITRAQVRALCLKYNLVFAPDFMFAGEIPEKNQEDRSRFKLKPKHDEIHVGFSEALAGNAASFGHYGYRHEASTPHPDNPKAPFTAVINQDFGLCFPGGFQSLMEYGSVPWNVYGPIPAVAYLRCGDGFFKMDAWRIVQQLSIGLEAREDPERFFWGTDRIGTIRPTRTMLRLAFEVHPDYPITSRASQCQMVVCPGDMLSQDMPITLKENWEAGFSERDSRVGGRGFDPIILQPVEHGFLVVTKWGAEAKHPEFQNEQEN